MATRNKTQLLAELKELGIKSDEKATNVQLEALIESAPARITPKDEVEEPKDESAEDTERITNDEPIKRKIENEETIGDYLRQYQVRKGTVSGSKESDPEISSRAFKMKEELLAQARIRTLIPRAPREAKSIPATVNLNGYRLDFPKNTWLELPEQISAIITESQEMTDNAIARDQIDGNEIKETALL